MSSAEMSRQMTASNRLACSSHSCRCAVVLRPLGDPQRGALGAADVGHGRLDDALEEHLRAPTLVHEHRLHIDQVLRLPARFGPGGGISRSSPSRRASARPGNGTIGRLIQRVRTCPKRSMAPKSRALSRVCASATESTSPCSRRPTARRPACTAALRWAVDDFDLVGRLAAVAPAAPAAGPAAAAEAGRRRRQPDHRREQAVGGRAPRALWRPRRGARPDLRGPRSAMPRGSSFDGRLDHFLREGRRHPLPRRRSD